MRGNGPILGVTTNGKGDYVVDGVYPGAAVVWVEKPGFQFPEGVKVGWRSDSLVPAERFINGTIQVPERPGFGIDLNEAVIRARSLPL